MFWRMVASERLIELLQPAAPAILEADARAVAHVAERKHAFAALDKQPASAAMAGERRAIVATEMRTVIAPKLGWVLVEDHLKWGAYEWVVGDDILIRLSKTTRESRLEAVATLLGIQGALFETAPHPAAPRDQVLIRLMGNPLVGASVDVVPVARDERPTTALPLRAVAATQAVAIPNAGVPAKTTVSLPSTRRSTETG
jgi:hypothetical protein